MDIKTVSTCHSLLSSTNYAGAIKMQLPITYHDLTHHIVPGPQSFSYFIPLILLPIALLIPRSVLSQTQNRLLFLPPITLATLHAWHAINGVDVISVDVLLWAYFLLLFRDPWRDFRRVDITTTNNNNKLKTPRDKNEGSSIPYPQTSFRARLQWVGTLLVSIRLTNWIISSPPHDRRQPTPPAFPSRSKFLTHALLSFIRGYIILDLTAAYISTDPYFTHPQIPITSALPSHLPTFIPPLLLRSMVLALQLWALISQLFHFPSALPVLFPTLFPGDWSPHTWPPYFGPPSVVLKHGLRGFWGRYWHQTMRFSVSGPRELEGTGWRYVLAFGLSGVVHMGLVPPEPLWATVGVGWVRAYVAGFFWVQIIGIGLEVVVARLVGGAERRWREGNGLRVRMLVNACWVVFWFVFTLPLLGEMGRQLGYWRVWPVPVSVWRGVRGEGWVAWPFLL